MPGVGYGVSEISIINFLKTHELTPELGKKIDIYAFALLDEAKGPLNALVMELRQRGLQIEQAVGQKKLGKHFSHGDRISAKKALFIGEDEMAKLEVGLKCLSSKEQKIFPINDIDGIFSEFISSK